MSIAPSTDRAARSPDRPVLRVRDLEVRFAVKRDGLFSKPAQLYAVDGVSSEIASGRTLGLVGEAGSGKSTAALAAARLIPARNGQVEIDGADILTLQGETLRQQRHKVQFIFQDPYSSLNPRLRASEIVREPLDRLGIDSPAERARRVSELFRDVGLRPEQERLFPHQFSGSQRQRLGIARALASRPKLVICDEPVSALDVAVQAQILNLLRRLQREHGLTYLFISHDLGVIQHMCNEVAVMYTGRIVEHTSRVRLFTNPLHPYTKALFSSVPSADPTRDSRAERILITGDPPSPIDPPSGCRFVSRCPIAVERCRSETPPLIDHEPGHRAACHRVGVPIVAGSANPSEPPCPCSPSTPPAGSSP